MQIIEHIPSVAVVLDQRRASIKPESKGKFPVKLRVTFQVFKKGKKVWHQQYYPTKIMARPDEFVLIMDKGERKTKISDYLDFGRKLREMESRANRIIKERRIFDQHNFELHFLSSGSLMEVKSLFEIKIKELYANDQISSAEKYESALSVLLEYGGQNLTFGEITEKWLRKFERWYTSIQKNSQDEVVKPAYELSSLGFHLRCLRHVMNRAVDMKIITDDQYPFGPNKYVIKTVRKSVVKYLGPNDRKNFMEFRSTNLVLNYYHDFWRLSYYCNGANFADLLSLRNRNFGSLDGKEFIEFDRQKTLNTDKERKSIIVVLKPWIQEIIDRHRGKSTEPGDYVFPIIEESMTAKQKFKRVRAFVKEANKAAKKIAEELKLGDITTYTARHTFSYMLILMGGSTELLQDSLGHNQASTTEHYKGKFSLDIKDKFADGMR